MLILPNGRYGPGNPGTAWLDPGPAILAQCSRPPGEIQQGASQTTGAAAVLATGSRVGSIAAVRRDSALLSGKLRELDWCSLRATHSVIPAKAGT